MARFSVDEETSGTKRKKKNAEAEDALKRRRWERSGKATSALSAEEEEEEGEESEEDGDEEMEEIGSCLGGSSESEFLTFRMDADVLECSICFEPLRPPVFQCKNGHIACSTCCPKLFNKCHVCSRFIGRRRCLALEKVIESLKCQCQYVNYGCKAIVPFVERASHEETCSYAALFCPISDCTFSGSKQQLTNHVKIKHCSISKNFSYDETFMLTLERQESCLILLGDDGHIFLLLNSYWSNSGNALSVICIGSNMPECKISYELRVHSMGSSLQLRSSAQVVKKWSGVHPAQAFLVVPNGFCCTSNRIYIHVCIHGIPM